MLVTAWEIFLAFCTENMAVTVIAVVSAVGFVTIGATLIVLNILRKRKQVKEAANKTQN